MIKKKIIEIKIEKFTIGKIYPWKNFIFLFDVISFEMLQLSPSHKVVKRVDLKEHAAIKQIDSVFFDKEWLIIADSISKKLFKLDIELDKNETVIISGCLEFPLKTGSIIAAAAKFNHDYLLLDKGHSMIRVYSKELNEEKTIGSRMGYVLEYEDQEKQRLGFEFPEDMAVNGNRVIVSDSGNKRLVVMDQQWQLEKIIKLPEFPYKILNWNDDQLVVSDFDRSLMMVSLKYGFVHQEEIDYPVDFFPSIYNQNQHHSLVGSEKNELVELSLPDVSWEFIAETAANWNVSMKIKLDNKKIDEARKIVEAHKELLLEYAKSTTDDYFKDQLSDYINEIIPSTFKENETIKNEVSKLSIEFIKKYKIIPDSEDQEAANIDKENIRHRVFLKIKTYRRNLKKLVDTKNAVKDYPHPADLLNQLLEKRFETVKESILARMKEIEANLSQFKELDLLTAVVDYWLLSEEKQVLFRDSGFQYEKLFGDEFLLAILNDFYYNIARLFLKRNKIEEYITFCDREITMFPDKVGTAVEFINQLIILKKYDDARRMLGKFPDQNKENVNYLYYRVYHSEGDTDKAFFHLKKELDLYSHRLELIPQLIGLNKLKAEEVDTYMNKILEKAGQTIDIYLNVATVFQAIGDFKTAMLYVDKELESFPENQKAIAFKLNLPLNIQTKELERLVIGLTAPQFSWLRSRVYFILENFEKSWLHFKDFMMTNTIEANATANVFLMSLLNNLRLSLSEIHWLREMANRLGFDIYKKEIFVHLSYLKHVEKKEIDLEVEKFDVETYLSAYSTNILAYNHFFDRLKQLKKENKYDEALQLAGKILKYNPGDKKVFEFLDGLAGKKNKDEPTVQA
jgi:tetratricopeptide (TPR) repeat protein